MSHSPQPWLQPLLLTWAPGAGLSGRSSRPPLPSLPLSLWAQDGQWDTRLAPLPTVRSAPLACLLPFLLGSEITCLTALSPFGLSFFSTRSPLSPPSPFSSLPNSLNLCVFQTVENTQVTD